MNQLFLVIWTAVQFAVNQLRLTTKVSTQPSMIQRESDSPPNANDKAAIEFDPSYITILVHQTVGTARMSCERLEKNYDCVFGVCWTCVG